MYFSIVFHPGCLRPSMALTVQSWPKTPFIYLFYSFPVYKCNRKLLYSMAFVYCRSTIIYIVIKHKIIYSLCLKSMPAECVFTEV